MSEDPTSTVTFSEWAVKALVNEGVRNALDGVVAKLQQKSVCEVYRKAFKIAEKIVEDSKP